MLSVLEDVAKQLQFLKESQTPTRCFVMLCKLEVAADMHVDVSVVIP